MTDFDDFDLFDLDCGPDKVIKKTVKTAPVAVKKLGFGKAAMVLGAGYVAYNVVKETEFGEKIAKQAEELLNERRASGYADDSQHSYSYKSRRRYRVKRIRAYTPGNVDKQFYSKAECEKWEEGMYSYVVGNNDSFSFMTDTADRISSFGKKSSRRLSEKATTRLLIGLAIMYGFLKVIRLFNMIDLYF